MKELRENELNAQSQHLRQFPLDPARVRQCKMTPTQVNRIRDWNLDDIRKEEYVSPEEFAYLTGRTLKQVRNMMDRNQVDMNKEGFPGSKRPKRFIMLQLYWQQMKGCRAIVTKEEREWMNHLMKTDASFRRITNKNNNEFWRNKSRQRLNQSLQP
ncbi:TPA: hypothetical protein ACGAD2_002238 [Salmonella enterica subsp. enterica serovar Newport]